MRKLGHKALLICPTNELAEKYGKDGLTINKFFGFGVTEEEQNVMNKFNADEIFFNNVQKIFARTYNYVKHNPDKIIIATGDTQQLTPIADIRNQFDYKTCLLYTSPSPRDLSTSRMPSSA